MQKCSSTTYFVEMTVVINYNYNLLLLIIVGHNKEERIINSSIPFCNSLLAFAGKGDTL